VDFFKDSGDINGDKEYARFHLYGVGFAGVFVVIVHDVEGQRRYEGLSQLEDAEIQVFDRERQDKMYSPLAFVLGYRLSHLLTEGTSPAGQTNRTDIAVPFIFSVITYFMSGYRSGVTYFFIYFAINLLNHFINVTFAMWCVSLRRNFAEAALIANASLTFISLSCGFFIQAQSLPVYVRWIKYISYVYWGFGALSSNGIHPLNLTNSG
jgi:ABC-type multidrug transport system permease subunit